jgi:negative regulator of genetic competence, sporulation and motility
LDALYRFAEQWHALPSAEYTPPRTSLYEAQDGYDLVIYPATKLTRQQAMLLREYGMPIGHGEIAAAAVAEHGRLLIASNAFETLTGGGPHPPEPSDLPR